MTTADIVSRGTAVVDDLTERVTVRMDKDLMDLLRRASKVWPGLTPSQLIRDLIYEESGRLKDMVRAHEHMQSGDPEREQRGIKLSGALYESARKAQLEMARAHADSGEGR